MTKLKPYADYKNSGIDWLPHVPGDWRVARIKSCVRLVTDRAVERSNPVALENIEGWTGRLVESTTEFAAEGIKFAPGDVLFGKLRPYLAKSWTADRAGEAVGDFFVMRPESDLNPKFLNYVTLTPEFISMVDGSTFGSKMPRASWDFVANIRHPFPDPEVQSRIVSFLDRETAQIDELIGKQERLIELLAEKRQAIVTHAVTKGLDRTAPTKPSGVPWLGEIPAHWKVGPVKHFYDIVLGKMLQRDQEVDTDARLPYLKAASIRSGTISLLESNQMWFSKDEVVSLSLRWGDVLVVEGGSVGQSALVDEDMAGIGFEKSLNRVRPKSGSTSEYFQHYMTMARKSGYVAMQCVGATFMHLTSEKLGRMIMPFPPEHEQRQIASNIEQHLLRLENASSKGRSLIDLLRERRSAVISAAVTGKIDITNEGVAVCAPYSSQLDGRSKALWTP